MRVNSIFLQYLCIWITICVLLNGCNAVDKQIHHKNDQLHHVDPHKKGGFVGKIKKLFGLKKALSSQSLVGNNGDKELWEPMTESMATNKLDSGTTIATIAGGVAEGEDEQFLNPYKGVPSYEEKSLGASSDNFALANKILGEAHSANYERDDDITDACADHTLLSHYKEKLKSIIDAGARITTTSQSSLHALCRATLIIDGALRSIIVKAFQSEGEEEGFVDVETNESYQTFKRVCSDVYTHDKTATSEYKKGSSGSGDIFFSVRQSLEGTFSSLKEHIEPYSTNPLWEDKTEEALEAIDQSLKLLIEREANKNAETVQSIISTTAAKFVSNQVKHFEDTQDLLEYAPHFITDKIDAVTEALVGEEDGLLSPFIPGVEDAMKFANFVLKHHNRNGHEVALSVYEILQSFVTADKSCFEKPVSSEFGFPYDRISDLGELIIGAVSEEWEMIPSSSK